MVCGHSFRCTCMQPHCAVTSHLVAYFMHFNLFTVLDMRMWSADEYRYDTYTFGVQDVSSFVFSLQACNDGHIALSSIPHNTATRTYEFVVGGAGNTEYMFRLAPMGDVIQVGEVTSFRLVK